MGGGIINGRMDIHNVSVFLADNVFGIHGESLDEGKGPVIFLSIHGIHDINDTNCISNIHVSSTIYDTYIHVFRFRDEVLVAIGIDDSRVDVARGIHVNVHFHMVVCPSNKIPVN